MKDMVVNDVEEALEDPETVVGVVRMLIDDVELRVRELLVVDLEPMEVEVDSEFLADLRESYELGMVLLRKINEGGDYLCDLTIEEGKFTADMLQFAYALNETGKWMGKVGGDSSAFECLVGDKLDEQKQVPGMNRGLQEKARAEILRAWVEGLPEGAEKVKALYPFVARLLGDPLGRIFDTIREEMAGYNNSDAEHLNQRHKYTIQSKFYLIRCLNLLQGLEGIVYAVQLAGKD